MLSPVACARPVPKAAVPPMFDKLPATLAVSGVPLAAVKFPDRNQPVMSLVFQPPLRMKPCTPTGEEARNVNVRR